VTERKLEPTQLFSASSQHGHQNRTAESFAMHHGLLIFRVPEAFRVSPRRSFVRDKSQAPFGPIICILMVVRSFILSKLAWTLKALRDEVNSLMLKWQPASAVVSGHSCVCCVVLHRRG
jgi:hypothetical protein